MSSSINRIKAAYVDGRARNPRFIQNQLHSLHDRLVRDVQSIQNAIRNDSSHAQAEVEIEYYLTLACVKEQYSSVDFEQIVEEEYNLAKRKDFLSRRVAAGIVYVVPSSYTLFYSVIAPLSAAIAAGNCVVLQVSALSCMSNLVYRKLIAPS
jgi:acyl-CoA reductase-like NAD-dependent aldehyde dehydrogenase